jgi:hypothetical protein
MKKFLTNFVPFLSGARNTQRFFSQNNGSVSNFDKILQNNKEWAANCIKQEPEYFSKLVDLQTPKYLWIGCADSRVPAN